jgi:hypothetical protein
MHLNYTAPVFRMKKVAFLILFFSLVTSGYSQNYKLKAVVLYSFTRYVFWPESVATGDFEIKILGASGIEDELKIMAQSKKVGNRNIRVSRVENAGEIGSCHILVIPMSQSERLEEMLVILGNRPVLVVTEEPGLGARGSDINFVDRDGRLAFELNQASVNKRKLKVSTELTRLAILI